MFSEAFAENLWIFPQGTGQFHFVAEGAAEFVAKGWPSLKATRSSGWYQRRGVTTPVPMAMFRFEQAAKRPTGPIMKGVLRFVGENALTDPIAFKARNINKMDRVTVQYLNIANIAQMIDDVNNSREYSTTFDRCGLQPTAFGGAGFIPDDVRFSSSGSTLTASKSVFVAGHVGAEFLLHGGGENGTQWMGTIAAVISPTQATLSRSAEARLSVPGGFGPVRGSMTAGSKTLTLSGPTTTLDWTGRYVMVPKAGSSIHADHDLLVTRCVAQSGNVLTLATAAAFDVVNVPVILAPSKFTGKSDDQITVAGAAEAGHNNDYQVWGERNEFSYTPARGSAVVAVYQNCLEHVVAASKAHGSSPDMQNAAAGFCGMIVDHCKYITLPQFLLSWNGWSLDAAKVWIMGKRNDLRMPGLSIGTPEEGSHTALLKVDPRSASLGDCFVALDGFVNAPGWPKASQVFARYGLYGSAAMIERTGPFRVRDTGNNPMP